MNIHVTELQPGDRLEKDIFNDHGILILSANAVLNRQDIDRLEFLRVDYVDILPRTSSDHDPFQDVAKREISQQLHDDFGDAVQTIRGMFEQVRAEGKLDGVEVEQTLNPLIEHFKQEQDVVNLLLSLNSKDDYTYQHSVQVGMISYYLAKWAGFREKEAYLVGKCGYLHDIGKSLISEDILLKPSKLTQEEFEEVKKHTLHGYEILSHSFREKELALVALEHHERLNGSGYPRRLAGTAIHPYSRIVAVADVYSAMISTRVYQEKRDLLAVLKELHRLSFEELDPYYVQVFIKHMIPNFIGKRLRLTTGEVGIIVMINNSDFFRPLIRLENRFIDLSAEMQYEVANVYV
ncbi:HD-GYP domain-containing protein [Xylanibacillus composti]|uniref:HD family phosphohydrolase n=1 Tax=Xylanibacillus composti TaxID=1572762 RepID=A0A8J4H5H0_9BACL|nr:HD-GYP domain-containing protein [Xylanibacillus composti]MDT9724761.1 HD-GYP domain-containing protein [Xylanibacillus composti]GIQ69886.1 HD family phosphohydrolase [Xylanibacillus composti]